MRTLFIVDDHVLDHGITAHAIRCAGPAANVVVETVRAGEQSKQLAFYESVSDRWAGAHPSHIVLVGGGSLINVGLYFAAGQHAEAGHGGKPFCSIVPTNTMAMADVALGGLGLLNGADGRKNALRRHRDPDWIFLFPGYVAGCGADLRRDGVAEVLKHALLQRASMVEDLARLFLAAEPDAVACYRAARDGLVMKSEVLALDTGGQADDIEFLLSYGHLHAHVIEEAALGQVPHSYCVFIGMLIDLTLSGHPAMVKTLAQLAATSPLAAPLRTLLSPARIAGYLQAYPQNGRFVAGPDTYWVASVDEGNVGAVIVADGTRLERLPRSLRDIAAAYDRVVGALH